MKEFFKDIYPRIDYIDLIVVALIGAFLFGAGGALGAIILVMLMQRWLWGPIVKDEK